MRFEVNETAKGIVAPPKQFCKVRDCGRQRRHGKAESLCFCRLHSGLKRQMAKKKYKEFLTNNELVVLS